MVLNNDIHHFAFKQFNISGLGTGITCPRLLSPIILFIRNNRGKDCINFNIPFSKINSMHRKYKLSTYNELLFATLFASNRPPFACKGIEWIIRKKKKKKKRSLTTKLTHDYSSINSNFFLLLIHSFLHS